MVIDTATNTPSWDILDVSLLDWELDKLTDTGVSHHVLVGKKIIYHNGRQYPLVALGNTVAIKQRLHCEYCNKLSRTVYLKSGLHEGAFCYAYNKRGKYIANLRDQICVCKECQNKQAPKVEAKTANE